MQHLDNDPAPAQLVPRTPPLAWNEEGQAFELDRDRFTHWLVRRETGGRPSTIFGAAGPVRLEIDASWEQLRHAVGGKAGHYRLYPCDEHGQEHKPVAHVEVVAELAPLATLPAAPLATPATAPAAPAARVAATPVPFDPMIQAQFLLYERYLQSHERHLQSQEIIMQRLADTTRDLARATAEMQLSSAQLLTASAGSVRVANGLDALDRVERIGSVTAAALPAPPAQVVEAEDDAEDEDAPVTLADQVRAALDVTEAIRSVLPAEKRTHPLIQLVTGPFGMYMLKFAQDFATGVAQAHAAGGVAPAHAAKAAASATAPPTTPAPVAPVQPGAANVAAFDGDEYDGIEAGDEDPGDNPE